MQQVSRPGSLELPRSIPCSDVSTNTNEIHDLRGLSKVQLAADFENLLYFVELGGDP